MQGARGHAECTLRTWLFLALACRQPNRMACVPCRPQPRPPTHPPARQVLERAGVSSHAAASLLASAVGASKLAGVALSFCLVDSLGRRPLLVWGSAGCALALAALAAADWLAIRACLVAAMCAFIFAFRLSEERDVVWSAPEGVWVGCVHIAGPRLAACIVIDPTPPDLISAPCSASWAGVFWVLLSELFSMSAKSPATAAATAVLFLTGALLGLGLV